MRRSPMPRLVVAMGLTFAGTMPCQQPTSTLRSTDRPGTWVMAGPTRVTVGCQVVHGADVQTTVTLRWPQDDGRPPRHHTVGVACDIFGNRQPWRVLWRDDEATLWLVRTSRQAGVTTLSMVTRVDFGARGTIRESMVTGRGPHGFLPETIAEHLAESMTIPNENGNPPLVHEHAPTPDKALYVLCRVHVLGDDGTPLAGVPVRVAAVVRGEQQRHGGTFAVNSGLAPATAVADTDGWAHALVQISELAREHGVQLLPTVRQRAGAPRLQPRTLTAEAVGTAHGERITAATGPLLRGRLVDADGRPIAGGTVAVAPADDALLHACPATDTTDAHGAFVLLQRPEGACRLVVRRDGVCATCAVAPRDERPVLLTWNDDADLRVQQQDVHTPGR